MIKVNPACDKDLITLSTLGFRKNTLRQININYKILNYVITWN